LPSIASRRSNRDRQHRRTGKLRLSAKMALVHYWDTDIRHLGRSMNVQG
jgi:hypothetical protein